MNDALSFSVDNNNSSAVFFYRKQTLSKSISMLDY